MIQLGESLWVVGWVGGWCGWHQIPISGSLGLDKKNLFNFVSFFLFVKWLWLGRLAHILNVRINGISRIYWDIYNSYKSGSQFLKLFYVWPYVDKFCGVDIRCLSLFNNFKNCLELNTDWCIIFLIVFYDYNDFHINYLIIQIPKSNCPKYLKICTASAG